MSKFKKIFLIIPIIVCLTVSLVPFGVFAINSGTFEYAPVPSGTDPFYTLSKFESYYDSSKPYFLYKCSQAHQSISDRHYFYTFFVNADNFECEISDMNIIVSFSSSVFLREPSQCIRSDGLILSNSGANNTISCYGFMYNLESHDLTIYRSSDFSSYSFISGSGFHGVETNYFETDPNALDVEVTFNPALSGEIDRRYENDGKLYVNDSFKMTIKNNSRKAIQYRFTINNPLANTDDVNASIGFEGSSLDLTIDDALMPWYKIDADVEITDNGTALELLKKYYNDKYTYRYYTKEWCYASDPSSEKKMTADLGTLQYKATEWHYLQAGQEFSQVFNWNQINLATLKTYNVIVEAVATDRDFAVDKWVSQGVIEGDASVGDGPHHSGGGFSLNLPSRDNIQEVYRSSFYLNEFSGVQYDPTDCSNGIMPYSDISDISHYKMSYDATKSLDGSIIDYTSKDFYSDSDSWFNKGGFNIYNNSLSLDSSNSVNRLFSSSGGFLNYVGSVFSILPLDVSMIILLGVVAVITIGIIKRIGG